MGIVYNIIITLAPVAVGVGIGWFISRKGSLVSKSNKNGTPNDQLKSQENAETSVKTSSQKPNSLQTNPDSAGGNGRLPNSKQPKTTRTQSNRHIAYQERNTTVLYERNDNGSMGTQDIEVDSGPNTRTCNQSLEEDAVPATPIACNPQHIETHDAILLYAEEDRSLVKHIQQELMLNLCTHIDDLNIVLYEEFAPDVQSHFKTMEQLFCRCRFLFVVVTSNFREDSLTRYQHEIALADSIKNPSRNERVIPVWAEVGAQNFLHELSVLKGIDYSQEEVDFRMFKAVFQHGRRKIHL